MKLASTIFEYLAIIVAGCTVGVSVLYILARLNLLTSLLLWSQRLDPVDLLWGLVAAAVFGILSEFLKD